jgi:hypothetical protein
MLALFVALNLVTAPVQLVVYARKKEWFSAVAALAIPTLVWIAAVQIDFAHHGV